MQEIITLLVLCQLVTTAAIRPTSMSMTNQKWKLSERQRLPTLEWVQGEVTA